MSLFSTNWNDYFARLNERYGKRKHPLEYRNLYQLMIMTILSARDSDKHINQVAPPFFDAYPRLSDLARAKPRDLHPLLRGVTNYEKKCEWICETAKQIGSDDKIPLTLEGLVQMKGIGRKTALVSVSFRGLDSVKERLRRLRRHLWERLIRRSGPMPECRSPFSGVRSVGRQIRNVRIVSSSKSAPIFRTGKRDFKDLFISHIKMASKVAPQKTTRMLFLR